MEMKHYQIDLLYAAPPRLLESMSTDSGLVSSDFQKRGGSYRRAPSVKGCSQCPLCLHSVHFLVETLVFKASYVLHVIVPKSAVAILQLADMVRAPEIDGGWLIMCRRHGGFDIDLVLG